MDPVEIQELLDLKDWSVTKLAAELHLGENTVYQWLSKRRNPGGPATILMRMWLKDEKEKKAGRRKELVEAN